jgi:FxLD family lantipeptide
MTTQANQVADVSDAAMGDLEFDLDVSIVESGPAVDELMRVTDDGCGTTCASACTSCA